MKCKNCNKTAFGDGSRIICLECDKEESLCKCTVYVEPPKVETKFKKSIIRTSKKKRK